MKHKYYVIAYVPCSECGGTNRIWNRECHTADTCPNCNQQGDVEVRVPLTEALAELGVTGLQIDNNRDPIFNTLTVAIEELR